MKNILAIAFAILSLGHLSAQDSPQNQLDKQEKAITHEHKQHKHHGKEKFRKGGIQSAPNPELKAAMQKYRQETVIPAMQEEHKTMLKNLSKADRKFLEKKREEKATLNKKQQALRTAVRTAKEQGASKEQIQTQFKSQREALQSEKKAFMESMQEFIKRNETNLQSTKENLKTIQDKSKAERKNLKEQFKGTEEAPKRERPEHKTGEHNKMKKDHNRGKGNGQQHAHKKGDKFVKFLLWDTELSDKKDAKKSSELAPQATLKTSAYPNPAQTITTVKVELPKDVKSVQIRVLDLQGKTILTQNEKALAAGEQNIQLNVEKLPSGTYFYHVIADDLKISSSLIIAK